MFYVFLLYVVYHVECFYVPAMAPHEFKSGEPIELKVPDFFKVLIAMNIVNCCFMLGWRKTEMMIVKTIVSNSHQEKPWQAMVGSEPDLS